MIIDLDAHQGNGHEKDFSIDSMILTYFLQSLFIHYDNKWHGLVNDRKSLYSGHVQS